MCADERWSHLEGQQTCADGIDDASLYPLQPCLPRGLRSALLRKASVLRNWLLRKWDARQPSSAFSRSPLMLQSRVLLHCCVLRMCAETNFSHPFLRVESEGCIIGLK